MSRLGWLNALSETDARTELLRCCGSRAWSEAMASRRPFASESALLLGADETWWAVGEKDWLEAFAAHPRIGNKNDVAQQQGAAKQWASGEQSGAEAADAATLRALADANAQYEQRFGHIYIVCATGKTAAEMLGLCRARLDNRPADELRVAAEEQRKITRIRLDKLLRIPQEEPAP